MPDVIRSVEGVLSVVLIVLILALSLATDRFLTAQNAFDLLNNQAVNVVFAVGLVVVLITGGIDISFAVAASVVQYVAVSIMISAGGGNWFVGFVVSGIAGLALGLFNAFLIHRFRIISIIATIGTFSLYFGLLMYFTRGRSIYDIPDWLYERTPVVTFGAAANVPTLFLPVLVMAVAAVSTWYILSQTGFGRTLYGFGSNPEAARRSGVRVWLVQAFAYGWLGICAGIAGLMQVNIVREVVPNALYGRELEILAAVVLGGAVLGGGRGSVFGAVLGVLLLAVVQNGLNLLGISPFAFQMIVGFIILIAVTATNLNIQFTRRGAIEGSAEL